jgi:hypothetical protein
MDPECLRGEGRSVAWTSLARDWSGLYSIYYLHETVSKRNGQIGFTVIACESFSMKELFDL